MKKILILQSKGRQVGGVWFVNKTLAEGFANRGYKTEILCVRNNQTDYIPPHSDSIRVFTINETDKWEITKKRDILNKFLDFNFIDTVKLFVNRRKEVKKLHKDYKKIHDYILEFKPDIIINTHYELLHSIPKQYLGKTINEIHTSFNRVYKECKDAIRVLKKYDKKLGKMVWLTSGTCQDAKNKGFKNSTYIYNPIKFQTEDCANIIKNKKLITLCRLSSIEKRIDLMVDIVNEVFSDSTFKEWDFELYGPGVPDEKTLEIINNNEQIHIMGNTENVQEALMQSSLYLLTSPYEGLALSVLEAMECGIPTIAYYFGESTNEEIINNETGIVLPFGEKEMFVKTLKELMSNEKKMQMMSKNCKIYAKNFSLESVLNKWENLFNEVEKGD